jgi:hypothetical protein
MKGALMPNTNAGEGRGGLGKPLDFDFSKPVEPHPDGDGAARLEKAFRQIRELYAQVNPMLCDGIGRSDADDLTGDAYRLIWSAVHGGDFDPVTCLCGRRLEASQRPW